MLETSGIESGLTFLGFGLPESTPSLGTLVSYAKTQMYYKKMVDLVTRINHDFSVDAVYKFYWSSATRAADARQRKG